ncbi:MAG: right-handed parallel beta-helix repeat-containing protein [Bryobacterales bacterium]|nr:right-handed parallel beta-helix repeat-containing protein [Bryobacterales bacterium]
MWSARGLAAILLLASCGAPDAEERLRQAISSGVTPVRLADGVTEVRREIVIPAAAGAIEIAGGANSTLRAAPGFSGRALLVVEGSAGVRFRDFAIDGNRDALQLPPQGLPPYDVPFAEFTRGNGILILKAAGCTVERVVFRQVAGFAVLGHAGRQVRIDGIRVEDSGSRNPEGRNNTTGGVLLEGGAEDFSVTGSRFTRIRGNGVWTHSLYTAPRNARGTIRDNHFERIGRDAVQVGHATRVTVERNRGREIGYPLEEVDALPVAIDTAGNTDESRYAANEFEEVNGKCIDLDGFHHGEVTANRCTNRQGPEAYPHGGYAIVMNNTNPDMQSVHVTIRANVMEGMVYGGAFIIGRNNRVEDNRFLRLNQARCGDPRTPFPCNWSSGQPDLPRSGIYLGSGAERPAPASGNVVAGNEITGFGMRSYCVAAAPGVPAGANRVAGNRCAE